jgi:hypothetical protein
MTQVANSSESSSTTVASQRFTRRATWLVPGVITAAFVIPVAALRALDGDEGYYAFAAKLVAHGKTPYTTFWFQQMPLVPYVYGAWQRLGADSWYALRALSVVLTIGLAYVLYGHVLRRWSSRRVALAALLLFATTPIAFDWYPTIKTYALSTLLLFGAYVVVESRSASGKAWFWAGLLFGLSVDTRLLFASLVVVFLVYAGRRAGYFLVGLAVGALPSVWFFATGPKRFLDDTLGSQTTRGHLSLTATIDRQLRTAARVLVEPHFLLLTLAGVVLLLLCIRDRKRLPMSVAIAAVLGVTNLLPTPTHAQYFVTLVPFLVVAAIELAEHRRLLTWLLDARVLVAAAVLLVLPALVSLHGDIAPSTLRPSEIRAISRAVDRRTRPGEVVLSFWPGYIYESHVRQLPGLESDFEPATAANEHLSGARAKYYRLLSTEGLQRAIRTHAVPLIVYGGGAALQNIPYRSVITHAGYREVERVGRATLYALPP